MSSFEKLKKLEKLEVISELQEDVSHRRMINLLQTATNRGTIKIFGRSIFYDRHETTADVSL